MVLYEKVRYQHRYADREVPFRRQTFEYRYRRDGNSASQRDRRDQRTHGNDYTQDDFEQARRELLGFADTGPTDAENDIVATGDWLAEGVDRGHKAPVRPARDEQTFGEDLVKEGVEEATHHTMLAATEESARKDQV